MSLEQRLIGAFFGDSPPQALYIGLGRGGREIEVPGYLRRLAGESWQVRGSEAVGEVEFGPFKESATFDSAILFERDEILHVEAFESPVTVAAGMSHRQQLIVGLMRG